VPLTQNLVDDAIDIYPAMRGGLENLAVFVRERCEEIARDAAVRARVQHRVKTVASLETKLLRDLAIEPDRRPPRYAACTNGFQILRAVRDLVGVRVVPYREADREVLATRIAEVFEGTEGQGSAVVRRADGGISPNPNYRAVHLQVAVPADDVPPGCDGRFSCEIQVVGALAHVWNELEHDIGYKRMDTESGLSDAEQTALQGLADLTRAGDHIIELVLAGNAAATQGQNRAEPSAAPFRDSIDLAYRMRSRFPHSTSFAQFSQDLFGQLVPLGLDSEAALDSEVLGGDDYESRATAIVEAVNSQLAAAHSPHRMDVATSDALYALVLAVAASDIAGTSTAPGRPLRARAIANAYLRAFPGASIRSSQRAGDPDVANLPAWRLIQDCAQELGRDGRSFSLKQITSCVQNRDPARRTSSLAPVVQGMTRNAPGGPPSPCGEVLFRVGWGRYEIYDPTRHDTPDNGDNAHEGSDAIAERDTESFERDDEGTSGVAVAP
jgi:ppGpp synthetase/RelA/SpoT-type nucleotidyltranferase